MVHKQQLISRLALEAVIECDFKRTDGRGVGGVMLDPRPRSRPSSVAENDSDNDCVALDGDPDKLVEIENSNASDSDELLARTTGEIPRGAKEIWASDVAAPRMEAVSCY
ncbi:hypothetical protein U1Q18_016204 [Sarracenia purpurea var. burkii]